MIYNRQSYVYTICDGHKIAVFLVFFNLLPTFTIYRTFLKIFDNASSIFPLLSNQTKILIRKLSENPKMIFILKMLFFDPILNL